MWESTGGGRVLPSTTGMRWRTRMSRGACVVLPAVVLGCGLVAPLGGLTGGSTDEGGTTIGDGGGLFDGAAEAGTDAKIADSPASSDGAGGDAGGFDAVTTDSAPDVADT